MAADSFACEQTTPGTQVSVRAQKGLCPAQLAQLPCARTQLRSCPARALRARTHS